jgi:putative SOS response-associated peptidase YedK
MCGRFSVAPDPDEILQLFPDVEIPELFTQRWNVAPTQEVPAITAKLDGSTMHHKLESLRWGLVPSWAKDLKIGNSLINARAESLESKPAFRTAFEKRRCLILADGFYEWKREGKKKTPIYFQLEDGSLFCFAGLYEFWRPSPKEPWLLSCTIVTTQANDLVAPLHDRMPAIVPRDKYDMWLDPKQHDAATLGKLLQPFPASAMKSREVSPLLNSPANEGRELIAE